MQIFQLLITFLAAYLFGAVPWGFLIGKAKGVDIREHGSKNIGSTNVSRVVGSKWGKLCFFMDFMKGFLPSYIAIFILPEYMNNSLFYADAFIILAVVGAFIGHIFPVYLKFKGGKGVATGAGALIALTPYAVVIGLAFWIVIFKASRFVSLASIAAAIIVALLTIIFSHTGVYPLSITLQSFVCLMCVIVIIKHKSNIVRLLNGTENRFNKK